MPSERRSVSATMRFHACNAQLLVVLLVAIALASTETPPPCDKAISTLLPHLQMFENRSAFDAEGRVLYPDGKYWKDEVEGKVEYYGCPCDLGRPCLRKCCPIDQAINFTTPECIPYAAVGSWFKPIVATNDGKGMRSVNGEDHFILFYGGCGSAMKRLDPEEEPEYEYFLRGSDGSLSLPKMNESSLLDSNEFCLDYSPELNKYVAFLCSNDTEASEPVPQSKCRTIIYIIYPIGMSISIIFLIISFFVYAFIPELRNLHGKCLLCHIASLFTAYVFLVLVQVLGFSITDDACHASGFVIYFAFLSTFLWLNIMCIDMCIAFSGIRAMSGSAQERDRKKFILYMLYAWGLPLIPLSISLYLEFGSVPDHLLKPLFRRDCWFQTDESRLAYFIGPVATILTVNIALFIFTAVKIYQLKKQTKMLKKGDSKRHSDNDENRQRFNLYLKLFIVMGVNWALEIISWLAGGSECIWIPADLFNTLQGLFIFLIFVWKDKIRRKLMKRLCPRLAAKMKKHRKPGSSSSDGRSICTLSSTVVEGDIKLSSSVANASNVSRVT